MILNKSHLKEINTHEKLSAPEAYEFTLSEKILQFGTGVLLRGLPDYFISKANRQKVFNGKIIVIKSTDKGEVSAFEKQDNLFMHVIKGFRKDKLVNEFFINAAISRVIVAKDKWDEILRCAAQPELKIIISNTTEAGIVLDRNDDIHANPPQSFPAKLLAFLYARYKIFKGNTESGMVIIPTELITNNADKLKAILTELAEINNLENYFIEWLIKANDFCNSLVDRIVTTPTPKNNIYFEDELLIESEPYCLWAIETSSSKTKALLAFAAVDTSVVITNDITKYTELKLRLLNATHTFICALALLYNFKLVKASMQDENFKNFVQQLMLDEIAPCIINEKINAKEAKVFAEIVTRRFENLYIDHQWQAISANYTKKLKFRCLPLLVNHYKISSVVPQKMAIGFAAYLLYIKINLPKEDDAEKFYSLLQSTNTNEVITQILSDKEFWNEDLHAFPGFIKAIIQYINMMEKHIEFAELISKKQS